MSYSLPPLGYSFSALEPHIDAMTMEIHHDRHHQTYINNLNTALQGKEFESWNLEKLLKEYDSLPSDIKTTVRNNAGGHFNHSLFWEILAPGGAKAPVGKLALAIESELGGFAAFKESLSKASVGRFGSGWGWLVVGKDGKLAVTSTPNQDSPLTDGSVPILGIDVWEHAYYLKYQNKRADYVAAIFNILNWDVLEGKYTKAR
jgi:superoxide dismutase, Fe-Mn family